MSNGLPNQVVTITMRGNLPVGDPDPVPVEKDVQRVQWCAAFPFAIKIGPASHSSSPGDPGCANTLTRGPFPNNTGKKLPIKYSIIANGQENDPEIEIQP